MKRLALAASLAASLLGGTAASAMPVHGVSHGPVIGHGPVISHGPIWRGPVYGGPIFHPGPVGPGPLWPASFHRWGYGEVLPRAFFAPERFVDYIAYNLAAPPADFQWVQDGPDALLVNLDTGMVVRVVPNAFA